MRFFGWVVLIAVTTVVLLKVDFSPHCISNTLKTVASANGDHAAIVSDMSCYKLADGGLLVEVTARGDPARYLVFKAPLHSIGVDVTWEADHHLLVTYPEALHPQTWNNNPQSVSIRFQTHADARSP